MTDPDDELFAKLEDEGEETVSRNLAKGIYGSRGNKRELVVEWLRM